MSLPETAEELLIQRALGDLAEEVGLNNIVLEPSLEKVLVSLTRNAQIKWNRTSRKLDFICTSCGSKVIPSTCGKYECRTCDEVMMLPSMKLNEICMNCPSYQKECPGNLDNDNENIVVRIKKTKTVLPPWILGSAIDPE